MKKPTASEAPITIVVEDGQPAQVARKADEVANRIRYYQQRKQDAEIILIGYGSAIKHCLTVGLEVQKKFKHGLHQIVDTHLHAIRRCPSGVPEAPTDRSRIDEATVDSMLRFEPAENRTCEGKFAFLVAQKKHALTPQVIVTLSTRKLDTQHIGYHRPKVPLMTIERPSEPN